MILLYILGHVFIYLCVINIFGGQFPPFIFLGNLNPRYKHQGGFCQLHSSEYGPIAKHCSGDYHIMVNHFLSRYYEELWMHQQITFWGKVFRIKPNEKTKARKAWVERGIIQCEKFLLEQEKWLKEKRKPKTLHSSPR